MALALAAAASLAGGVALAQQPGHPQPGQPPPGRPIQGLPGGHPPVPGMPGSAPGMQPGMQPRPVVGPDGRPLQRPGTAPGQRPGMPPGFNPRPRPAPAHEEADEPHTGGHAGGGEHECPGHGPEDPPPPPNLWHGLITVNNEASDKGGFLNKLLFRYENPKDPCDPKNEPPPLAASLINFGVLAFVLFRFGKKPLAEALVKRKHTIMADIDTATKLKEDAEARLDDYEEKLENIEGKLAEVRAEYAAQAEVEKKHILAEAEERRVRMRRDAEFRVEQEMKTARAELLREAVLNAVSAAEELMIKQVNASDLDKMANDYLKSIGPSLSGAR
jgi:F-type H+-transporting ATPase subunit b